MFKLLLSFFILSLSIASADDVKIKFTKKEQEWLSKHQTIKYVYDPDWAPFEWKNDIGNHTGILADIIQIIQKKTDIYFIPISTDTWKESVDLVKQGSANMYSGVVKNKDRASYMNFSFKDIYSYQAVLVANKKRNLQLNKLEDDLKNLKVGIISENGLGVYIEKKYPLVDFISVDTTTQGFKALEDGTIDVFTINKITAKYFINKSDFTGIAIVKELDYVLHLKIALSKQMSPLALSIIDKALASISENELNSIFHKWTDAGIQKKIDYKLLSQIAFGIFLLFLFLLWHNRKLKQLVNNQTSKLKKTLASLETTVEQRTQELNKSKQNLENVTNALTDSIYYKDLDFNYTWVNDAFCKYAYLPREEIIGKSDFDLFDEDVSIKSNFQDSDLVQNKESIYFEDRIQSPIGKTVYISSQKHALVDTNGKVYAIAGTISNITIQKETEIEIRRQKDFVQTLIDSQEQLIVTSNTKALISVNATFLDFFAVNSIEDFKEEYGYDCVCDTFNTQAPKGYLQKVMGNENWIDYLISRAYSNETHKVMITRNHSDFIFSVTASKLPGKGEVRSVIFSDITELEHTKELAEKAELQAKNANASKSEFLANMSHEIRTPMNAIIGFSELLHEQVENEHLKQFTRTIQSAGHTLLELINDILDISKIEAGKMNITPTPTNPYNLLEDTANIFSLKLQEKGIDLIVDIDNTIPVTIIIDEVRVRQILLNLIGNAVKFTSKGFIKLSARPILIDDEASTVDLEISVQDSGIGIKKDQIEKIFKSFEQQDGQNTKEYGGTGLGLSISTKLAKMMNGEIRVESKEGEGATFFLVIHNISISSIVVDKEIEKARISYQFKPATILLVDDIKNNRELVQQNFKNTQITVLTAHNGKVATEIAQTQEIDLVLMDIRMPIMDGYEAAEIIKEMHPQLPIIALTASVMEDEFERVKSKNFSGYLRKPVLKANLFEEISKHLAYEIETVNTAESKVVELSSRTKSHLEIILNTLDKELTNTFHKIQKSNNMTEAKHFAVSLLELSKQYEITHLEEYAESLLLAIEIFDIMGMKKLLGEYEQNIALLKI